MLTDTNPKSFDVGEIFILEALASSESALVILVLQHWIKIHEVRGGERKFSFENKNSKCTWEVAK